MSYKMCALIHVFGNKPLKFLIYVAFIHFIWKIKHVRMFKQGLENYTKYAAYNVLAHHFLG